MKLSSLLIVGLVAIAASAVVSSVAQRSMSGRVSAAAAPQFELLDSTQKPVSLQSALQNRRAVLLNFWFVGCPPCREEFPQLEKLYQRYKARGLEVVGINTEDEEPAIEAFRRQFKPSFRLARDPERKASGDYSVVATPTNILIDAKGNIIWRSEGFDKAGLQQVLDETLK